MKIDGVEYTLEISNKAYESVDGKVGAICMTNGLFGMLIDFIGKHKMYLEIGTFDGILISSLAERYKDMTIYAIDAFVKASGTGGGHLPFVVENCKRYENISLFKEKSVTALKKLKESGYMFDVILVDGDHSYEATKIDLNGSWEVLAQGGTIMVHDYGIELTKNAVDEFVDSHRADIDKLSYENIMMFSKKIR